MNVEQYYRKYGMKALDELGAKAGTTRKHLYAMVEGRRRPSVELAERLVEASNFELNFVSILRSKKRKHSPKWDLLEQKVQEAEA